MGGDRDPPALPAGKAEPRDRAGPSRPADPPAGTQGQEILSPPWFPSPTSGWGPQIIPPQYPVSTDLAHRRTAGHSLQCCFLSPNAYISPVPPSFHQQLGGLGGASQLYLLLLGCCVSPRAVLSPCERRDALGQVPKGESGLDQATVAKFGTVASEQARGHVRAAEQVQGAERV